jgi:hypothetical protein
MSEPNADRVWNRAALEAGGPSPAKGDRALAALLLAHGLVMNGGVHHALRCMQPAELMAAAEGFSFFSLADVAGSFTMPSMIRCCLRGQTKARLRPTVDTPE